MSNNVQQCSFGDRPVTPSGIISSQVTDSLLRDSVRKQIVSFSQIILIDSTNKTYLLPVGQSNLANEESTSKVFGLVNGFGGNGKYDYEYDYSYRYNLNNLIIYHSETDSSKILFKNRILVSEFKTIGNDGEKHVLIMATDKDSNNDKYWNYKDLQELYLYSVKEDKLVKIQSKNKFTTLEFYENKKTKDVICELGIDRNGDGKYDFKEEPRLFYKLNLETKKLVEIVSINQIEELQKLLEGQ